MTREEKYAKQMMELGIYHPVFDPAIHTLAIMERENQRAVKALKAAEANGEEKAAAVLRGEVAQQRRDILTHRDALGLTPKGLRRLRAAITGQRGEREQPTVLALLRAKKEAGA